MKSVAILMAFISTWILSAIAHDLDITRECDAKGTISLILGTVITCEVKK